MEFRLGYAKPEDMPMTDSAAEGSSMAAANANTPGEDKAKPPYTQALVEDLQAYRTQAFQAALAHRPDYALTLALYTFFMKRRAPYRDCGPAALAASSPHLKAAGAELTETSAGRMLDAIWQEFAFKIDAQGDNQIAVLERIHALSDQDKSRFLAYFVATSCTVPLAAHGTRVDPVAERIGAQIGVAVEDHWRPTATDFWSRVSKETIIGAVTVCTGMDAVGASLSREKKKDLALILGQWTEQPRSPANDTLQKVLITNPDAADRITHWLPEGMAFSIHQSAAE